MQLFTIYDDTKNRIYIRNMQNFVYIPNTSQAILIINAIFQQSSSYYLDTEDKINYIM